MSVKCKALTFQTIIWLSFVVILQSDSPWDSEDGGNDDIPEIPEPKTVELNKV